MGSHEQSADAPERAEIPPPPRHPEVEEQVIKVLSTLGPKDKGLEAGGIYRKIEEQTGKTPNFLVVIPSIHALLRDERVVCVKVPRKGNSLPLNRYSLPKDPTTP